MSMYIRVICVLLSLVLVSGLVSPVVVYAEEMAAATENGEMLSAESAEAQNGGTGEDTEEPVSEEVEIPEAISQDAVNGKLSGTCGSKLTWELEKGVLTISGSGSMYDYDFWPSDAAPWLEFGEDITSVKMGKNVATIGAYAFNNCLNLKSITIPGNIKKIGAYAFLFCSNLKDVKIEDGVTTIGEGAFHECHQLTSIILPDSVTQIDDYAFWNCYLKTITFPANVSVIGDHIFETVGSNTLKEIIFKGNPPEFAPETFYGVTANAYYPINNTSWTPKVMKDYGGDITWIDKCVAHELVTIPGKKVQCDKDGLTDGKKCSICGTVVVKQETIKATGHKYTDKYDATCDVCGYAREEYASVPMHRMYDPNSSEHFYTGSTEEVNILVKAGWNYEGVGFNFPAEGKPVYRLYHKPTGEHLYTMSEEEKAALLTAGWNYEGVAFNSADKDEVPQYRLHNPNATRGAYHFTGSTEERDNLISLGWEYQGIGWYSCLK